MPDELTWGEIRELLRVREIAVGDVERRCGWQSSLLSRVMSFDPEGFPSRERWDELRAVIERIDAERTAEYQRIVEGIVIHSRGL